MKDYLPDWYERHIQKKEDITMIECRKKDYIIGGLAGLIAGVCTCAWMPAILAIVVIVVITELALFLSAKYLL